MCGRYGLVDADPRMLGDRFSFRAAEKLELEPRYNIAPTDPVLIVRAAGGERVAELARWELFSRRNRSGGPLINVRSETAVSRAPFRDLLDRPDARVLMPADAFYEWLAAERPRQPRVPVRYSVDGGAPFAFAGLRSSSRRDGSTHGCALLTTDANALVAPVHDRMPVILPGPDAETAWLDEDVDAAAAAELLRPLDPERMSAARASRRLNDVRNDGPELWQPDPDEETAAGGGDQPSLF